VHILASLLVAYLLAGCSSSAFAQEVPTGTPSYSYRQGDTGVEVLQQQEGRETVVAVALPGPSQALLRQGDVLYVARGREGVTAVSISDPKHPQLLGTYDTLGEAVGLSLNGHSLAVRRQDGSVLLFDVTVPGRLFFQRVQAPVVSPAEERRRVGEGLYRAGSIVTLTGLALLGVGGLWAFGTAFGCEQNRCSQPQTSLSGFLIGTSVAINGALMLTIAGPAIWITGAVRRAGSR